jgi:hypothetical protein
MAKILVIDSHKGTENGIPQNMHWQNSKIIADYLGADLIWSYPNVNTRKKTEYEIIIFVHASHYSYIDIDWITLNPEAKLFYVTNEYNLGEPLILWSIAKLGRKYSVIANHSSQASKVVSKYTKDWDIINLNCLIYSPKTKKESNTLFQDEKKGCIYYGAFRKDRSKYFKKYLNEKTILSTHPKNVSKFLEAGANSKIINRINWAEDGLFSFRQSLYIEDEKTHTNYNYLANRFYEALNYGCVPIFGGECSGTVELSGYEISDDFFIEESSQIESIENKIPKEWHDKALEEKKETLKKIESIVLKN